MQPASGGGSGAMRITYYLRPCDCSYSSPNAPAGRGTGSLGAALLAVHLHLSATSPRAHPSSNALLSDMTAPGNRLLTESSAGQFSRLALARGNLPRSGADGRGDQTGNGRMYQACFFRTVPGPVPSPGLPPRPVQP